MERQRCSLVTADPIGMAARVRRALNRLTVRRRDRVWVIRDRRACLVVDELEAAAICAIVLRGRPRDYTFACANRAACAGGRLYRRHGLRCYQRRTACGLVAFGRHSPAAKRHAANADADDWVDAAALGTRHHVAFEREWLAEDGVGRRAGEHPATVRSRIAFPNERRTHAESSVEILRGL